MRLDINYRKRSVKNTNTWRLNSALLNNQEITEEIKEEIKKYVETNDNENTMTQNIWGAAKVVLRGNSISPQETRKISNKQSNLYLKQLEKEEQRKPKVSRRKEIIKIRAEINEIEMKKTIAKINKTKSWLFEKINKIDKPSADSSRKKVRGHKSIKLEMKKEK